jgi:hypothetical protein
MVTITELVHSFLTHTTCFIKITINIILLRIGTSEELTNYMELSTTQEATRC